MYGFHFSRRNQPSKMHSGRGGHMSHDRNAASNTGNSREQSSTNGVDRISHNQHFNNTSHHNNYDRSQQSGSNSGATYERLSGSSIQHHDRHHHGSNQNRGQLNRVDGHFMGK